jgi:hypothetical protein
MRRCFGSVLLVAVGLLLGAASSSVQRSDARPLATSVAADDAMNAEMLAEIKEIKTQLKEINTHLRSGVTKVFVNMNPGAPNGQ